MSREHSSWVDNHLDQIRQRDPNETEFHQAVREVLESVAVVLDRHAEYREAAIIQRLVEPERSIQFRVPWVDDEGRFHVNRGYRVEHSSAIGPYKGGLRFHPTVNLSVLKFLAFEQIFKNSLTTQPIGAGKGGSDFNPRERSDSEVMRFCQSFMTELQRYIGDHTDIPAGDIGVGLREIGYLFGQYKRLANRFDGSITGKGMSWGGSHLRPEATGYGVVYFAAAMLEAHGITLEGKHCLVSGAGNVAQYTVEKLNQLGATVITMSDSDGYVIDEDGIDANKLAWVMELKNIRRGRIAEYVEQFESARYVDRKAGGDSQPLWAIPADCAFPCATENEIDAEAMKHMIENGATLLCEGANMPLQSAAIDVMRGSDMLYGPGKAANAGGVAVSSLEMAQNAMRLTWTRQEVQQRLREIMQCIHDACVESAQEFDVDGLTYLHGANIAGFRRVADAMLAQGVV